MKRTPIGERSPNPSTTHSRNRAEDSADQDHQQQANSNQDRTPNMHAIAANDPAPANSLFDLDADAELPDWDEFEQMLPHTPPVENRRNAPDDEASSLRDDELSTGGWSPDESSSGDIDENIGTKISAGLAPLHDTISVRRSSVRELNQILEVCKCNPQITALKIEPDFEPHKLTQKFQESLIEFFKRNHTIQRICIKLRSFLDEDLDPGLLTVLFEDSSLQSVSIKDLDLAPCSSAQRTSCVEALRKNSTLKELKLTGIYDTELMVELGEAIARNSTLTSIALSHLPTKGMAQSLAALLRSNRQLKTLKISMDSYAAMRDLSPMFEEMKENNTLETLRLTGIFENHDTPDLEVLQPLMNNQNLHTLELPSMGDMTVEAINNLSKLFKTLDALTSLGLGCVPHDHENRLTLARSLASIPRLEHLELNLKNFFYGPDTDSDDSQSFFEEFLNILGECTNLKSLKFSSVPDLDFLSIFLETLPYIRSISLDDVHSDLKEPQEQILALVKNSPHLINVSCGEGSFPGEHYKQFREELQQAVAINREIQLNIRAASEAMKDVLDQKSMTDEALPFVPLDVTDELAKAIARHVPPAKTKAIFDELILHASKIH